MANSFFKFKEFTIHQDQCGMKVTTDACLFGALIAEHIQSTNSPARILDIGTGTGLLSLMLAQVSSSMIDALEIDQQAYLQAKGNFKKSPWANRLSLYHTSFQDFSPTEHLNTACAPHTYDLIVCNPPFFSQHLTGKSEIKNKAVHDKGELLKALPEGINSMLSINGICFVLLPDYEMSVFASEMKLAGLHTQREVVIHHKTGKPVFRRVLAFGNKEKASIETEQLFIHQGSAPYSERFTALLKPYYLHL